MRVLIIGCRGQDGKWLSEILSTQGYEVYGIHKPTLASGQNSKISSWKANNYIVEEYCVDFSILKTAVHYLDQIQPGVTHTEADVVPGVEIPVRTGPPTFVFEQMPVIDLTAVAETVNYGAAKTITATARNANGSPISGRSLTLSASVSGASASCSGRKTTATTNSAGRATFKVCPVKTATWSVDGRAIVGSAGVRLTVQLTPTAPRTLVAAPKTRSVSLTWVVPVKANASAVSDYVVQYRVQGASTWVTFRDGTNTARKATVTGLTSGQVYEFRVTAKNKSGAGTWSGVVLGTPN